MYDIQPKSSAHGPAAAYVDIHVDDHIFYSPLSPGYSENRYIARQPSATSFSR